MTVLRLTSMCKGLVSVAAVSNDKISDSLFTVPLSSLAGRNKAGSNPVQAEEDAGSFLGRAQIPAEDPDQQELESRRQVWHQTLGHNAKLQQFLPVDQVQLSRSAIAV